VIELHKVIGYTLSYCPWCKKTKKFFQERGIEFEFVDYDLLDEKEQSRIEEEMLKHTKGGISFPYVVIDGTVVIGWNPGRYEELLKLNKK
jgi:glutaredoxin